MLLLIGASPSQRVELGQSRESVSTLCLNCPRQYRTMYNDRILQSQTHTTSSPPAHCIAGPSQA